MLVTLFGSDLYPIVLFVFILFLIFWIYSLLWVAKDISWRTTSLPFQVFCIVLVALTTPLLGLPVYFLLRPIQRYDRKLLKNKNTVKSTNHEEVLCVHCGKKNDSRFEFCTFCGEKVVVSCQGCSKNIPAGYYFCPYCGADNPYHKEH